MESWWQLVPSSVRPFRSYEKPGMNINRFVACVYISQPLNGNFGSRAYLPFSTTHNAGCSRLLIVHVPLTVFRVQC